MKRIYRILSLLIISSYVVLSVRAQSAHWNYDAHSYEYEMGIYFSMDFNGTQVTDYSDYEIAAFYASECRGVASTVQVGDKSVGYIRVRSNQVSGERISFKVYVKSEAEEYSVYETVDFSSEALQGIPSSPMTLTVMSNELVVVYADDDSREYGAPNPYFTYYNTGILYGEPDLFCDADESSAVGTYTIYIYQGSIMNPNVSLVDGMLITPASLTASVGEYTKKQGEENPAFTLNYEGFKNNDDESVLSSVPTVSCEATAESEPGEYVITVSGGSADNYNVTCVAGKLTILEADAVVVTANSYTREYGDENPTFDYSVSGAELDGEPELSCDAKIDSPVGTYPITIKKGNVKNYNDSYVDGTLTVTKAPLTVSVGDYTIYQGSELPTFTLNYSGFKNGETESVLSALPTISCDATAASSPGEYVIEISGGDADNYSITYITGRFTIVEVPEIWTEVEEKCEVVDSLTEELVDVTFSFEEALDSLRENVALGEQELTIVNNLLEDVGASVDEATIGQDKMDTFRQKLDSIRGEYAVCEEELVTLNQKVVEYTELLAKYKLLQGNATELLQTVRALLQSVDDYEKLEEALEVLKGIQATLNEETSEEFRELLDAIFSSIEASGTLQQKVASLASALDSLHASLQNAIMGIGNMVMDAQSFDVFTLDGKKVRTNVKSMGGLPVGIYIIGGKKIVLSVGQ